MCLSGKMSAVVVTQSGAPSSGNQMPEMNEIGRNVSWASGIACSLVRTSEPAARPSAARQAAPSAAVTIAAGQRREVDVDAERRDGDDEQQRAPSRARSASRRRSHEPR